MPGLKSSSDAALQGMKKLVRSGALCGLLTVLKFLTSCVVYHS